MNKKKAITRPWCACTHTPYHGQKNAMLKSQKRVWTGICLVLNSVNARRRTYYVKNLHHLQLPCGERLYMVQCRGLQLLPSSQITMLHIQNARVVQVAADSTKLIHVATATAQFIHIYLEALTATIIMVKEFRARNIFLFIFIRQAMLQTNQITLFHIQVASASCKRKGFDFLCVKSSKACNEQVKRGMDNK